ncbi:hypothetical protein H0H93_007429 [Arthromyces matolae]|nr:hypothetical protein H0H93_007429 [Arthromyces matolae]
MGGLPHAIMRAKRAPIYILLAYMYRTGRFFRGRIGIILRHDSSTYPRTSRPRPQVRDKDEPHEPTSTVFNKPFGPQTEALAFAPTKQKS